MSTPVIDAHHHLWDPQRRTYPWLTDDLAPIVRPFELDDLLPLLDAAGVAGTVLVQTIASVEETRAFLAIANGSPRVRGVVGWVDLTDPDVDAALQGLVDAGGGALVGIRHQVHDEPDPAWLRRPDVGRGLDAIARIGLVYDLLVRTRELPAALDVVRSRPDQRFIIDHLAKPPIASGDLRAWREALEPFGGLPQVSAKLSGLVTEADWATWTVDDLRPAVADALRIFGPGRLLFGSDWPVSLLAAPYERVMRATRDLIADLSEPERAAILGGNAVATYGL